MDHYVWNNLDLSDITMVEGGQCLLKGAWRPAATKRITSACLSLVRLSIIKVLKEVLP